MDLEGSKGENYLKILYRKGVQIMYDAERKSNVYEDGKILSINSLTTGITRADNRKSIPQKSGPLLAK